MEGREGGAVVCGARADEEVGFLVVARDARALTSGAMAAAAGLRRCGGASGRRTRTRERRTAWLNGPP